MNFHSEEADADNRASVSTSPPTLRVSIPPSIARDNDATLSHLQQQRDRAAGSPPSATSRTPVDWNELERQRRIVQSKFGGSRVQTQEEDGA